MTVPALPGWGKRIKFTIDHDKIDSALTWFPVTVYLSSTHGDCVFDELLSDANRFKIAFTKADGVTQLYAEIEKWDTASEVAIIHVSRDGWDISTSQDTDFYMYYNVGHSDNTAYIGEVTDSAVYNVWDDDFVLVVHMNQDPTDGSNVIKDSTQYGNHGTTTGSMDSNDLVAGKIGNAIQFDGSDDTINFGSASSLNDLILLTCEAWVKVDGWGPPAGSRFVAKAATTNADGWQILTSQNKNLILLSGWSGVPTYCAQWKTGNNTIMNAEYNWTLVGFIYDSEYTYNNPSLFIDETARSTSESPSPSGSRDSDAAQDLYAASTDGTDNFFEGIIDEIRMSKCIRSAAWWKATYWNGLDGLLTYGSEELCGGGGEFFLVFE